MHPEDAPGEMEAIMISFIPGIDGGYTSKIKVENNSMLLIINITWWFPNTKKNISHLCKIMYQNQVRYEFGDVMDLIIKDLYDYRNTAAMLGSISIAKKINKNIDYLKIINGLYGG